MVVLLTPVRVPKRGKVTVSSAEVVAVCVSSAISALFEAPAVSSVFLPRFFEAPAVSSVLPRFLVAPAVSSVFFARFVGGIASPTRHLFVDVTGIRYFHCQS